MSSSKGSLNYIAFQGSQLSSTDKIFYFQGNWLRLETSQTDLRKFSSNKSRTYLEFILAHVRAKQPPRAYVLGVYSGRGKDDLRPQANSHGPTSPLKSFAYGHFSEQDFEQTG